MEEEARLSKNSLKESRVMGSEYLMIWKTNATLAQRIDGLWGYDV